MLAKQHRLPSQRIRSLIQSGSRINTKLVRIVYKKNDESHARLAFVVSKTVSKHAVKRNQLLRKVREIARQSPALLSLRYDVVFLFAPTSLTAETNELAHEMLQVLTQTKK